MGPVGQAYFQVLSFISSRNMYIIMTILIIITSTKIMAWCAAFDCVQVGGGASGRAS